MANEGEAVRLEPTAVEPLRGGEKIGTIQATVQDFWSFAFSDLRTNVVRGVLAEFLVARAVQAKQSTRETWDDFDVLAPDGTRIEVKSSAYLQSWVQRRHSTIRFSGLTGRSWDSEKGYSTKREVRADVFVFAVQTCKDPAEYDVLDVEQWRFWVVTGRDVELNGARSVGIGFLDRHGRGPISWDELAPAIAAKSLEQKG